MIGATGLHGLLKGLSADEAAKVFAFLVAPALVLGITFLTVTGHSFAIDLDRPVTIAELRTEVSHDGTMTARSGVALIIEPASAEYRVPLTAGSPRVWMSLDSVAARANMDRIVLRDDGLANRAPFVGVSDPVLLVVEGAIGKDIEIPGGREPVSHWLMASRQSASIVSSVLLSCVFAFGMALSMVLPFGPQKHAAG